MRFPKARQIGEDRDGKPIWHFNSDKIVKWRDEFEKWFHDCYVKSASRPLAIREDEYEAILERILEHWLVSEE
jgi:hypothetical protein